LSELSADLEFGSADASLQKVVDDLERLLVEAQDLQRSSAAHQRKISAPIPNFDGTSQLTISVMLTSAPWHSKTLEKLNTPAMITHEEAQYYDWISSYYEGIGRVLELGSWLGASTQYIVRGLTRNPHFAGQRLHVVDDFVWRASWMNNYVGDDEKLANHASFRHLFDKYTRNIRDLILVQQAKLTDYDGNENLPQFSWRGDPIEFLYVDCGRAWDANQAWYLYLRPYFVRGRTLIMMQDWRLHRERPRKWFNQTREFTESKGTEIELIHEVTDGGLATFLYKS
jgi:Methyltransferase domain